MAEGLRSSQEKAVFERALLQDPYDRTTRLVFADWAEEHGQDDLACELRRQATPQWEDARRRLEDFATYLIEMDGTDWKLTLDQLVGAMGKDYQARRQLLLDNDYDAYHEKHSRLKVPFAHWSDDHELHALWDAFFVYTGVQPPEDRVDFDFISCCSYGP